MEASKKKGGRGREGKKKEEKGGGRQARKGRGRHGQEGGRERLDKKDEEGDGRPDLCGVVEETTGRSGKHDLLHRLACVGRVILP